MLKTTAVANSDCIVAFENNCFLGSYYRELEWNFQTDNKTNSAIRMGWYADANNYCTILFDTAVDTNNIYYATNNAGAGEVRTDTNQNLPVNK